MVRTLGLVAVIALAAIAMTSGSVEREREREHDTDSRRKVSGVHRAGPKELAVRDRWARDEAAKLRAKHRDAASVPATTWVSLGPTEAFAEFNDLPIPGIDSGRPNTIAVDPRDPNVVYMAVSGGGVWKSFDFLSATGATWSPLSDNLPDLAVGAFAIDTANPDTIYVGAGDFVDASGNTVTKSGDGGGTWGDPVELSGMYATGVAAKPTNVRSLGVQGQLVLAGTDAGLFVSTDGASTFALVDLPNSTGGKQLLDAIWSIAPTGGGAWVLSDVRACDAAATSVPVFSGVDASSSCTAGNDGEVWTSADGMTWKQSTLPFSANVGRITLAAGPTTNPATTVVYAFVADVAMDKTVAFWRSDDGGKTFVNATGTLARPTLPFDDGEGDIFQDCADLDIGHDQSWYNQAIVVDPTNPAHVLLGGNLVRRAHR